MSMRGRTSAWFLLLIFGLIACMQTRDGTEDLAGTSVGTGNPGKVKVGFKNQGVPFEFSGRIEVYGTTQIPVPGFNPEPLAVLSVEKKSVFTISPSQLASIPDTIWPRSSIEGDSLFRFNLVIEGGGMGAIVGPLELKQKEGVLAISKGSAPTDGKSDEIVDANLVPLQPLQTYFEDAFIERNRQNYLFVYGTGYSSKGDSGRFLFAPMPQQVYELVFVSFPGKDPNASAEDSAFIYKMSPKVTQGEITALDSSQLYERFPMPDLYLPIRSGPNP